MRRFVDILIAAATLIVLSPLLLAIAVLIVLDSPGNPLYRAWRIGQGGRKFRMWKFRTMRRDRAEAGPAITGRNDPRVTRAGRILRRTKMDELPQFINLLTGAMTLVGPRPEAPEFVRWDAPEQWAVLSVKPGITGVAQLAAGEESDTIPEEAPAENYYIEHLLEPKLRLDVEYLQKRTAWSDAKIVLATAALVFRGLRAGRIREKSEPETSPAPEI